MPTPSEQFSLLEELDARQNDVLEQLDQLNSDVERLLREATHEVTPAPTSGEPEVRDEAA